MSKRHDRLFDDVMSGFDTAARKDAEGSRTENRFLRRSSGLAERAGGAIVEKTHKWVDPATCRMWARHNRRYDLLDEHNCADLIEGMKAQGGQEFPAIVRALPEGGPHRYEVICGARRHWTVTWLRDNNYPAFRFLIEVRELTDEEAFRLADVENRDRRDITDYERAVDYAQACALYYDGHQGRMAERLNVSNAWISRYMTLARLPDEIVRAYCNPGEIREVHARKLKPLLADDETRGALFEEAARLAGAPAAEPLSGAETLARLVAATARRTSAPPQRWSYASAARTVITATRTRRAVQLSIDPGASRKDVEDAFADFLEDHFED